MNEGIADLKKQLRKLKKKFETLLEVSENRQKKSTGLKNNATAVDTPRNQNETQ